MPAVGIHFDGPRDCLTHRTRDLSTKDERIYASRMPGQRACTNLVSPDSPKMRPSERDEGFAATQGSVGKKRNNTCVLRCTDIYITHVYENASFPSQSIANLAMARPAKVGIPVCLDLSLWGLSRDNPWDWAAAAHGLDGNGALIQPKERLCIPFS